MKRWHIVVIAAAAVITALVAGGSAFYKYYIVPKYMEPVIQEVKERLQSGDVLDELYDQAVRFHDEGIMDDETYTSFMRAYKSYNENAEDSALAVLRAKENDDAATGKDMNNSSVTARYASSKVGVEMIQTNDGIPEGKVGMKYSTERTSDRIKAEDVVEAEKVIAGKTEEISNTSGSGEVSEEQAEQDEQVASAYSKLKANMTGEEFSTFLSIMNKLSINTLRSYINDKEGLKAYLHENLSDTEYREIVNLGYKYMNVLLKDY